MAAISADAEIYRRFAELALEAKRADIAGECLRRAAAVVDDPEDPDRLHAAGITLCQQNQHRHAEAALIRALRFHPDRAEWHDDLGVILAQQNRYAEAAATFQLALRLNPKLTATVRNAIRSSFDSGNPAQVLSIAREARQLEPDAADLIVFQARAHSELQQFDEAIALLNDFLKTHHDSVDVWNRLGVENGNRGLLSEAEKCFREQIRLDPQSSHGYANLAAALGKSRKWAEAAEAGRHAVQRNPNDTLGWSNLGNAYRDLGKLPEAEEALREAIRLDGSAGDPIGNLALTLAMGGRLQESLPWYEMAVKAKPNDAEVHFNRALAYLTLGDYDRGFREYEWRWQTPQMTDVRRAYPCPVWDGSSLAVKTILVHTEQGLGDAIQFARYITRLSAEAGRVVVMTHPALKTLFRTVPGVGAVITPTDPIPPCSFHIPIMSLARHYQTRVDSIPNQVPYLAPTPASVTKWTRNLIRTEKFTVGIAWQGNPKHIGDRWRSVPLAMLAPLAALPNIKLVSLQNGPGVEQLQEHNSWNIGDAGSGLDADLNDLAGLISQLDLVISVDTAVVHLAGALGKRAWVAVPVNNDWRWLKDRTDSPWYPTVKIFRQSTFGDWKPVYEAMAQELSAT